MTFITQAIQGGMFPDYEVTIVDSSGGISLTSVLSDALDFSNQVDWAGDNILPDKLNSVMTAGVSMTQKIGLTSASGLKISDTEFKWQGTANQSFSLSLVFALNESKSVLSSVKALNKLVYPKDKQMGFYTAPLGYKGGDDAAGLLMVSIGSWFQATNVVCKSNDYSIDRIFDESGKPILAKTTLQFSANKLLTADEMNAWFRG